MNTKPVHNFRFSNITDKGSVRAKNEDYFGCFDTPNGFIFIVSDGMGGHVGGEYASRIAVETIRDVLMKGDFDESIKALYDAFVIANQAILDFASQNKAFEGMGATCVSLLIKGNDVYYAHVGDSRIYYLHKHELKRITKDHSLVQTLVDTGAISEAQAENHPRKNIITNALGIPEMLPPTIGKIPIRVTDNDVFLLCTDGLTGMVSDSEILSVLDTDVNLHDQSTKLVEMANKRGGHDNITLQIVRFVFSKHRRNSQLPSIRKYLPYIILLSIIATLSDILIHEYSKKERVLRQLKNADAIQDSSMNLFEKDSSPQTFDSTHNFTQTDTIQN